MNTLGKIAKEIVVKGTLAVTATAGWAVITKAATDGVKELKNIKLDDLIK